MKLKQIKQAYKSLDLIIHKHKFLIPAKPIRPVNTYIEFISTKKDIINQNKQNFKKQIKQDLCNEFTAVAKAMKDSEHPQYLEVKKRCDKRAEQYQEKLRQYKEQYIKPATYICNIPFKFYYSKNYDAMKKQNPDWSQPKFLTTLAERWRNLDKQDKDKVLEQYSKIRAKQLQIYIKYAQKHQIPQVKNTTGYNLFVSKLITKNSTVSGDSKINKSMGNSYKLLSQQQRDEYSMEAKMNNKQIKQKYDNFLKMWDISQERLIYIRNICSKYEQATSKKLRKATKQIMHEFGQLIDDKQDQQ